MKKLSFAEMRAFRNNQLPFMLQTAVEMGGVAHLQMLGLNLFIISEPTIIRELLLHHGHQMHRDPFVARVFRRFMAAATIAAARFPRAAHPQLCRHHGRLHPRDAGLLAAGAGGDD
jgi:hypothetical protein